MTALLAHTWEELGKCLALRAKSGSFLQDFAFHTKSLSVFQKASVWARQKCEIAKARLENPTPASGKSNSRSERIPPRYCCRLTLSNPRLNNCERRPPQNCRQCENTPNLRRIRRMKRGWGWGWGWGWAWREFSMLSDMLWKLLHTHLRVFVRCPCSHQAWESTLKSVTRVNLVTLGVVWKEKILVMVIFGDKRQRWYRWWCP